MASNDARPANELGNVLTSLQKSLSRVSRDASNLSPNQARSLVVGKVNFEMAFKCDPTDDALLVKADGGIALKLTGNLEVDIRSVVVNRPQGTEASVPDVEPLQASGDIFGRSSEEGVSEGNVS